MATELEYMQNLWKRYELENDYKATGSREVVEWAVKNGLLQLPDVDPMAVLAGRLSRALRQEYATDSQGRRYRVNHALRVKQNGVQHTMWGILGHSAPEYMEGAFTQRRDQVIGDCCQLKTDVDVYNDMLGEGSRQFELILDFTDDVAEREQIAQDDNKAA